MAPHLISLPRTWYQVHVEIQMGLSSDFIWSLTAFQYQHSYLFCFETPSNLALLLSRPSHGFL